MKRVFVFILLFIGLFYIYARYINTYNIDVKEYTIKANIGEKLNGFKIIHFSDILYDYNNSIDKLTKVKDNINKLNPDIIVFTGDLISSQYKINDDEKKEIISVLKEMNANLYKYAIIGDNDQKNIDEYKIILEESDFKLLDNKSEYIFYQEINPIKILGITNDEKLDELKIDEENIHPILNIALTHYPDNIEYLANENIDIVLAGHSLGGQIRLPFVGGILKKKGARYYLDDYYEVKQTKLYVNNGIGVFTYPFRTFNAPTINLYRLQNQE